MTRREMLSGTIPAALTGVGFAGAAFGQTDGGPSLSGTAGTDGSLVQRMLAASYADGQYQLPALPYAYDALEPHIDEQTMHLHHDKHHQAYVNGLNNALKAVAQLQASGEIDAAKLAGIERDISFNAGGHLLHSIFWATMGPAQSGGEPTGAIADALGKQFGSADAFRKYFSKVAATLKGSGWALLCYEPVGDRLFACSVNEHDAHLIPNAQPLLPLDVWEHAYYLKYQNNRAAYVESWWKVVNWAVVDESYRWLRSRSGKAAD